MSAINIIALIIHILCVLGILILLLLQVNKNPRKLKSGVLHLGLTALLAGIVMMGLHNSVEPDQPLNNTKYGIKLLVLLIVLTLGYKNVKKPALSKNVWLAMTGLVIFNLVIALAW
jgi:hypothetical protein